MSNNRKFKKKEINKPEINKPETNKSETNKVADSKLDVNKDADSKLKIDAKLELSPEVEEFYTKEIDNDCWEVDHNNTRGHINIKIINEYSQTIWNSDTPLKITISNGCVNDKSVVIVNVISTIACYDFTTHRMSHIDDYAKMRSAHCIDKAIIIYLERCEKIDYPESLEIQFNYRIL